MSDNKAFIWAQGQEANVKEPIQALKENGWRYGDVPTASNFNWILKILTQEIASLRKELIVQREELLSVLEKKAQDYEAKLNAGAAKIDKKFTSRTERSFRSCSFNNGISRQICMMLSEMEQSIRHYHPDFPEWPWPLTDEEKNDATRIEEEGPA